MKRMMISLLGLSATLLLSGCAAKPEMSISYGPEKVMANENVVSRLIIVEGVEAWRSPSDGYNKATRNIHVLQNAADATLNEGYKYFTFVLPRELAEGSMMNTAEEYINKCAPSSASILQIGNNACGFQPKNHRIAPAAIYVFKEQPKSYLTYNAQDVKDYLMKNDRYRSDSYEKVKEVSPWTLENLPNVRHYTKY